MVMMTDDEYYDHYCDGNDDTEGGDDGDDY